jgi:membrane-associated protein
MDFIDPKQILQTFGLLGISLVLAAETGLLIGFFLPGDTLLLSAGVFASQGLLQLPTLLPALCLAAIIGDNIGYTIGQKMGKKLFTKKDSLIFNDEYIKKSEAFYEKHGGKTIILARFIPIVRTFAPMIAGATDMKRQKFMLYNVVGALIWVNSITLLGYTLASRIPHLDKYILPVVGLAIVVSFAQPILHILQDKELREKWFALIFKKRRKN